MRVKCWVNTGLLCAWSVTVAASSGTAMAGDSAPKPQLKTRTQAITAAQKKAPSQVRATPATAKPKSSAAAVTAAPKPTPGIATKRTAFKVVRAQNNPFEEEFEADDSSSARVRVTPVSAEEFAADATPTLEPASAEIPMANEVAGEAEVPVVTEPMPAAGERVAPDAQAFPDSAALRRLKDRSAKDRMEQIHQEWLKSRKERELKNLEIRPENVAEPATRTAEQDPFANDAETVPALPPNPNQADPAVSATEQTPDGIPVERPITAPKVQDGKVRLQSQPKPLGKVPSDEELLKLYQTDNADRLPPPVRDPSQLPKISDIKPVRQFRNPTPGRQVPEEDPKRYIKLGHTQFVQRTAPESVYSWEPTNFTHQPLYFEDPALERYGHALPPYLQPFVSVGRFSGQLALIPYQMTMNPPCSRISPLGWYAPGDYVPFKMYQFPLNAKAAAVEAATILGVGYATP